MDTHVSHADSSQDLKVKVHDFDAKETDSQHIMQNKPLDKNLVIMSGQ